MINFVYSSACGMGNLPCSVLMTFIGPLGSDRSGHVTTSYVDAQIQRLHPADDPRVPAIATCSSKTDLPLFCIAQKTSLSALGNCSPTALDRVLS
jgi:hypothetical protein